MFIKKETILVFIFLFFLFLEEKKKARFLVVELIFFVVFSRYGLGSGGN